jgi:glycerate 2-kinase
VISLIISDVIGNDLSVIASGLTYPDSSTYGDALSVLKKYGLTASAPSNVVAHLKRGSLGERDETPKSLDNAFNYILGDIHPALEAMQRKAQDLGLRPLILTAEQAGDTERVARQRVDEILAGKYPGRNALLIGGETTPSIPQKHGKGGRNQHFAALTPILFEGCPKTWVLASAGTDGSDYVADVAGGIVDDQSLAVFRRLRPDYMDLLRTYDSYTLLESVGNSLIVTGDTHTNVGDLIVYLLP